MADTRLVGIQLVDKGVLTFGACDVSGPIHMVDDDGARSGYEPAVAAAIGEQLGVSIRWHNLQWPELYAALDDGRVDGIVYNQAITPARCDDADFTHPYGLFNESILVREDSDIRSPADLEGFRLGALVETTNMKLAEAFSGVALVEFEASAPGFFEMLEALRAGELDALVDDELFLQQFESDGFRIAFTVPTKNAYAIAVRKASPLRGVLDAAIQELMASGRLEVAWRQSFPRLAYEPPTPQPHRSVQDLREIIYAGAAA